MEFIVRGATLYKEPGVFMAFEEKTDELTTNVASLGFDLAKLQRNKKLRLDYVHIDRSEIEETGEYDLDGLFIRLEHAIDAIGAKRVVLDTIENLFSGLDNQGILRAELRRLFQWLKEKKVTAIITGEKGENTLTRHGLEEYVSDCVILLDHRIINQISTRRLRIIKYRGSIHGTNEYPFLIDEDGITVLPVTSLKLDKKYPLKGFQPASGRLMKCLAAKDFSKAAVSLYRDQQVREKQVLLHLLLMLPAGERKDVYFSLSKNRRKQIIRNMRSIGLDLEPHVKKGLLEFHSFRPGLYGLEMHLANIYKLIKKFKPKVVILDPITNFISIGLLTEVNSMLLRLIDHLQSEGITSYDYGPQQPV